MKRVLYILSVVLFALSQFCIVWAAEDSTVENIRVVDVVLKPISYSGIIDAKILEDVKMVLGKRLAAMKLVNTKVEIRDNVLLIFNLPDADGNNILLDTLVARGSLAFKDEFGDVLLANNDLEKVEVIIDESGYPSILLKFNTKGAEKLADATRKNIGKALGIYFDDKLLINPVVRDVIDGGAAVISTLTLEEANNMAIQLNSGLLPVEFVWSYE